MLVTPTRLAERLRLALPGSAAPVGFEASEEAILKRKLAIDTRNYFLSKVVPGVMGFLTVLVFVRVVGYDQFGRYAVVFATVSALAAGVSGWLAQGVLRFQSSFPTPEESQRFSQVVNMGTGVSALLGSIIVAISVRVTEGWSLATIVVAIGLYGVMLVYTVALARYQASLQSSRVMVMETVRAVGVFAVPLLLVLLAKRRHYSLLLLGICLGYLFPLAAGWLKDGALSVRATVGFSRIFGKAEWGLLRSLWAYGWPVALWLFCQQSLVISDRYFIQHYLGFSSAGVYASMYEVVVRSFSLVMTPITLAVHTIVMKHWNIGNRYRALGILTTGVKYQLLLFLPISIAFSVCAPWVSRVVLGKESSEAAAIVLPLALGGFLWQTALLVHKPLEILCQTRRMLIAMLAAVGVNSAGNALLIPQFGLKAPAYLWVVSSLVYLAMVWLITPVGQLKIATSIGHRTALQAVPADDLTAI